MEQVASIDIGTNTILLLIAKIEEGEIHPLFEIETITRLGEGVQKNGILLKEAMDRGLQTLAQYLKWCQEMGVEKIFALGTSALREAKNSEIFLKMSKETLGLAIEIISGEEEAKLSFLAVTKDLKEVEESILVVDVGGGSTEFILGRDNQIIKWVSLPLGSVRFTEQFLFSDPVQEEEWKKMEDEIHQLLLKIPRAPKPLTMVAVGGTATTLVSVEQGLEEFIPEKIHHFVLKKEALEKQVFLYRSKTIAGRKKIPGLSPSRTEVILAGAAILYMAMTKIKCPSVMISCHGVRYGVLYKKLNL